MSDLRKAAEMALEALENSTDFVPVKTGLERETNNAIQALRQALNVDAVNISQERVDETAKGEHEPVAWINNDQEVFFDEGKARCYSMGWIKPLYTAPPKREWKGLTSDDKHFLLANAWNKEQAFDGFMEAIDKFLEEKNNA